MPKYIYCPIFVHRCCSTASFVEIAELHLPRLLLNETVVSYLEPKSIQGFPDACSRHCFRQDVPVRRLAWNWHNLDVELSQWLLDSNVCLCPSSFAVHDLRPPSRAIVRNLDTHVQTPIDCAMCKWWLDAACNRTAFHYNIELALTWVQSNGGLHVASGLNGCQPS